MSVHVHPALAYKHFGARDLSLEVQEQVQPMQSFPPEDPPHHSRQGPGVVFVLLLITHEQLLSNTQQELEFWQLKLVQ